VSQSAIFMMLQW